MTWCGTNSGFVLLGSHGLLASWVSSRSKAYANPSLLLSLRWRRKFLLISKAEPRGGQQHGSPWHGNAGNYRCSSKNIKSNVVEDALLAQVTSDLAAPEFVKAILQRILELTKADAPDKELGRLQRDLTALDMKISRLSGLLAETSTPEPLLRKIEDFESERRLLIGRHEEAERERARASVLAKVTEKDIRGLLAGLREMLSGLSRDRLKDILRGIIEKVTLDPVTFAGHSHYRIPLDSGELVASPRGFEPRLSP